MWEWRNQTLKPSVISKRSWFYTVYEKIITTLGFYWDFLSNAYALIEVENDGEGASVD